MATDRPGGPDNPDRPTPDPAHPTEPPSPASESADSGKSGNPAESTPDTPTPPRSDRNAPTIRARTSSDPTIPLPGGPRGDADAPSAEPAATPTGPGESGSATSGPTPTLRFPAQPGESPSDAGAFGTPGAALVGAVSPPPGVEPPFTLPMPSLEPDAPPVPAVPEPPRRGSIITQHAGITQPRPPTVAEVRAREKARKRAEEQQQAEAEAAEAKQRKKKRILIGGAAVAGIAALVGGGYLVASAWSGPDVTASCTVVADKGEIVPIGNGQTVTADRDNQEIVVPDNYCSSATSTGHPGTHSSTFIYLGHSYRYYYGGNTTIGRAPTGGTTVAPKGATVKTKSGSTIQRGGLGAKIGGGS